MNVRKLFNGLLVAVIAMLVGGLISFAVFDTKVADGAPVVGATQPDYVVKVEARAVERPGYVETHCGTGTIVKPDLVLTNHHVVRDLGGKIMNREIIDVTTSDGTVVKATVLSFDKDNDFALLQLSTPVKATAVKLAEAPPQEGDVIRIGGFPGHGLVPGVKGYYEVQGKVSGFSSIARLSRRESVFIVNAKTFSGMSGSSAFNENGEIAGVMWGSLARCRVSDVTELKKFLDRTEYANEPAPVPDINVFGK